MSHREVVKRHLPYDGRASSRNRQTGARAFRTATVVPYVWQVCPMGSRRLMALRERLAPLRTAFFGGKPVCNRMSPCIALIGSPNAHEVREGGQQLSAFTRRGCPANPKQLSPRKRVWWGPVAQQLPHDFVTQTRG